MSRRSVAYCSKPSRELQTKLQSAEHTQFLVVQDLGPLGFVLQTPTQKKVTVRLGDPHYCSCCGSSLLCDHTLYVLRRVFRLSADNPLSWQTGLIDSELESIVDGRAQRVHAALQKSKSVSVVAATDGVVRRQPAEDDVCPICQDGMLSGGLVWCGRGCGNAVHAACFAVWAAHKEATGTPITCPLCRAEWAKEDFLPSVSDHKTRCDGCAGKIVGIRYKCLLCKHVNLCGKCFAKNGHSHHPFLQRASVVDEWQPAPRGVFGAQRLPADVVQALQRRDLTPADVDLIASLDAQLDLHTYLVTLLQPASHGVYPDTCVVCQQQPSSVAEILVLPRCNHGLHPACALQWATCAGGICPRDGHRCFHIGDIKRVRQHDPQPMVGAARDERQSPAFLLTGVAVGSMLQSQLRPSESVGNTDAAVSSAADEAVTRRPDNSVGISLSAHGYEGVAVAAAATVSDEPFVRTSATRSSRRSADLQRAGSVSKGSSATELTVTPNTTGVERRMLKGKQKLGRMPLQPVLVIASKVAAVSEETDGLAASGTRMSVQSGVRQLPH